MPGTETDTPAASAAPAITTPPQTGRPPGNENSGHPGPCRRAVATAAGEGSMAVRFDQEYLVSRGAAVRSG